MLLASCNQVNPSTDTSKASEDVSSKENIEESSKAEESKSDISTVEESKADEESSEAELDYVTEMTEEMANGFLKFQGDDRTITERLASFKDNYFSTIYNYKKDYAGIGNLNGYTLCYISPGFAGNLVSFGFGYFTAGDYEFSDSCTGRPDTDVNLYLYKDHTFITFEKAYEQGLFDPADAYELMCATGRSACVKKLK